MSKLLYAILGIGAGILAYSIYNTTQKTTPTTFKTTSKVIRTEEGQVKNEIKIEEIKLYTPEFIEAAIRPVPEEYWSYEQLFPAGSTLTEETLETLRRMGSHR